MPVGHWQPYTAAHASTVSVSDRRVPYAKDRLLLPPPASSYAAMLMRGHLMDLLYPIHHSHVSEDN